jgi:hypothetical protein
MASITIKKADGVTDIIFDQLTGAGGDNQPAEWRQDTGQAAGFPVGHRPKLKVGTKWNGPRTARVEVIEASFPYATQDSTTTLYSAKDQVVFKATLTLPVSIPSANLKEAAYQIGNLMAATLIKQVGETGYAPR